jgi:hypothetical protein
MKNPVYLVPNGLVITATVMRMLEDFHSTVYVGAHRQGNASTGDTASNHDYVQVYRELSGGKEVGFGMENSSELTVAALHTPSNRFTEEHNPSLSSRVTIAAASYQTRSLMLSYVEPLIALTMAHGMHRMIESRTRLLDLAWYAYLQNQWLYSQRGTISDDVCHDVLHRYGLSGQISKEIVHDTLVDFAFSAEPVGTGTDSPEYACIAFNPSPFQWSEISSIQLPPEISHCLVEVKDESGNRLETERRVTSLGTPSEVVEVALPDVPAMGYRVVWISVSDDDTVTEAKDYEGSLENEYMSVWLDNATGMLSLYDKLSGQTYEGDNQYVDSGDAGDAEFSTVPERDTIIDIAANTPLKVERHIGPLGQSLTYLQIYRVPAGLTDSRDARQPLAAQFVPVSILTTVTLRRAANRIDFDVTVTNNAHDHRLSSLFRIGPGVKNAYVDYQFGVYAIDLTANQTINSDTSKPIPQGAFATLMSADSGFTLANRGLQEVTIISHPEGATVALTLFRSTGTLRQRHLFQEMPLDDRLVTSIPEAQVVGEHHFEYSLILHQNDLLDAWAQARHIASGGVCVEVVKVSERGNLGVPASLVEIDNKNFVITTAKPAEDGRAIVIRGYNCDGQIQRVKLALGFSCKRVERCLLNESSLDTPVKVSKAGLISLTVKPHEIVSLKFWL